MFDVLNIKARGKGDQYPRVKFSKPPPYYSSIKAWGEIVSGQSYSSWTDHFEVAHSGLKPINQLHNYVSIIFFLL